MSKPVIAESSGVAQVEFRVRCEGLGRGEEVFLIRSDDLNLTSVSILCLLQMQVMKIIN